MKFKMFSRKSSSEEGTKRMTCWMWWLFHTKENHYMREPACNSLCRCCGQTKNSEHITSRLVVGIQVKELSRWLKLMSGITFETVVQMVHKHNINIKLQTTIRIWGGRHLDKKKCCLIQISKILVRSVLERRLRKIHLTHKIRSLDRINK